MNEFSLRDNNTGLVYIRIDKRTAAKMFAARIPFVICACNLQPFGGWAFGMYIDESNYANYDLGTVYGRVGNPNPADKEAWYSADTIERPYGFQDLVSNFESYNCVDSETGKYASYYVRKELLGLALAQSVPTQRTELHSRG